MLMKYYKQIENNIITGYISCEEECKSKFLFEITEEEYETAISELVVQEEVIEQSKDERIAELEAENAALLYQVLTGEELTDV